jgi:hypothetical protein
MAALRTPRPLQRDPVVERLVESMFRNWSEGHRPPEFHLRVRHENPDATLAEFNHAADLTWPKIVDAELADGWVTGGAP